MKTPSLTVILPAFKEERSIETSVRRLISCLDDAGVSFLIRVVVDGPEDGTASVVKSIVDSRLSIIELDRNFGKGRAVRIGLQGCTTDFVGYMDADLDLHPEGLITALDALTSASHSYVGAIGSKVHPDSQVEYPASRRFLSAIYKKIVRLAFSLDVEDSQTGLKVFRRSPIELVLPNLESDGFEFDLELLVRLSKNQGKFISVPVTLDYCFESTVNLKTGIVTLWRTARLAAHLRN